MADGRLPVGEGLHVVIVGAGFGGLACARALGGAPIRLTVVDQNNFHLFVPLLYQVATAALSPADIAQPIRKLLRHQPLTRVLLDRVVAVDWKEKQLRLASGKGLPYDRLVLATGSSYSYFGHEEWSAAAPAVKTIEDALRIRARLITALERAEASEDPKEQARLLTIVIVGGGPTGVEMAGAVADLARFALDREYRRINSSMARIVLVEAGPRLLAAFPDALSEHTRRVLEKHGVNVLTGRSVQRIDEGVVTLDGEERVEAATIIWGAGVKASPAASWLELEPSQMGRIPVGLDFSVPDRDGIYIIGDSALVAGEDGKPLPALAQVAAQEGRYLGKALRRQILDGAVMSPFRFHDRGNTAVISAGAAVYDYRGWKLKGFIGWIFWAIVHVYLLTGFQKRILVATQWLWRLVTYEPGARIITGQQGSGGARAAAPDVSGRERS